MKNLNIDRANRPAEVTVEQLAPQSDPSAVRRTHRIVLTIGGKRYELTHHTEVREIMRGPATLTEMPGRSRRNRSNGERA